MLSIIVAKAKNNIIGKDNKLLWHLPDDLKRFKELTTGHNIIMGRKTFESLGRVLPNRKHIVFTQNPDFKIDDEKSDLEVLYVSDILIDTDTLVNYQEVIVASSKNYPENLIINISIYYNKEKVLDKIKKLL